MKVKKVVALFLSMTLVLSLVFVTPFRSVKAETNAEYTTQENTGRLNRVPYNNETLASVDLGAGVYAAPIVIDMNDDGYMDLVVCSLSEAYKGTYIFYGSEESRDSEQDGYLLMDKGRYLTGPYGNVASSYLYDEQGNYVDTIVSSGSRIYKDFETDLSPTFYFPFVALPSTINGVSYDTDAIRNNYHTFVDIDGDSDLDIVRTISSWDEYGWSCKFNSDGSIWGSDGDGDPVHSWVLWGENTSGASIEESSYGELSTVNVLLDDGSNEPLDVYGASSAARFWDLDEDGDLDILLPSFMDDIYYFENISDVKNSNLNSSGMFLCAQGKNIKLSNGTNTSGLSDLQMELYMLDMTEFDWNSDGYVDLIVGEEDGRVSLLENTGLFDENGIPIFHAPKYFQTPADSLKSGMLVTPHSIDWDHDGDEDLIAGNSAGFITFIENITPSGGDLTNPSWDAPVRLTDENGNVIRHIAGYNGSVQGPAEEKLGYSVVTVADWDGDGIMDIMANDIWGKVVWYRGIEGETDKVCAAQPVTVEWQNGVKYPAYNWWKPSGNELVTYWRTTPFMIDLNEDELTDLVMCDYQGYMAFYERYEEDGVLKLKEGKRIFFNEDLSPMILATDTNLSNGKNRQKFVLADWNDDGKIDMIKNDSVSVRYFENVSDSDGEFVFRDCGTMYNLTIAYHTTSPTVCDWDKDGKEDVLVGAEDGHIYYLNRKYSIDDTAAAYHLVAHYDFEGTEPLTDKAIWGNVADDLNVNSESNVTISDGAASITGTGALYADDSADISPTEELTVFFKARFSGSTDGTPSIVDKRAFSSSEGGESRSFGVYAQDSVLCSTFSADPGKEGHNAASSVQIADDTWKEYALVISEGADGYLDSYLYKSKAETTASEDDFILIASHTGSTATDISDSHAPLVIGNSISFDDFALQQTFDDVRIYDTALTTEQLSKILPSNTEQVTDGSDEYLVSKWTFNGSDGQEYKDTAPCGNNSDTLISAGDDGTASFENGIVTLTGNGALKATDSADISPTGEFTVFFRAKISAVENFSFIDKRSFKPSSRPYGIFIYNNAYGAQINDGQLSSGTETPAVDLWRNYALVVTKDSETQFRYTLYASKGEKGTSDSHYMTIFSETFTADSIVDNDIDLLIGNDINMDSKSVTRSFDEVRLYSSALTLKQIANIEIDTTGVVTNLAYKQGTSISTDHAGDWYELNGAGMACLIDGLYNKVGITNTDENYENESIEIKLQFNKTYRVNEISLYAADPDARGGFPVNFKLQAETSGGWTTVVEETGYEVTERGWQSFTFEEVECTAVRLLSTKNSKIDDGNACGVLLVEFAVYGEEVENIALASNGTVITANPQSDWAEITMNGLYGMSKLIDGDCGREGITGGGKASSYQTTPIEVKLEFNGTYCIDKIRMYAGDPDKKGGFPVDFSLDVYTTEGWQTVAKRTDYQVTAEGWQNFAFDEVECTAVRLLSTENSEAFNGDGSSAGYSIRLYEFEVYGSPIMSVPALPEVHIGNGDVLPTGYYQDMYYIIGWTKDGKEVTTFDAADADAYIPEYIELDMMDIAVQQNLSQENVYRFIASVDDAEKYQSTGFVFSNTNKLPRIGGESCIQKANTNNSYYSGIKAVFKAGEEAKTVYVADLYGERCENSSALFIKALKLQSTKDLPKLYVCAYVTLEDGTTVYGNVGILDRTNQGIYDESQEEPEELDWT